MSPFTIPLLTQLWDKETHKVMLQLICPFAQVTSCRKH